MNIGFDLDGVLAHIDLDTYKTLKTNKEIEEYYSKLKPYLSPYQFGGGGDTTTIITGRSKDFEEVTRDWLRKNGITCPLYIVGDSYRDHQDWSTEAWLKFSLQKARLIEELIIDIYFEDQATNVTLLKLACPHAKIIKVNYVGLE